MESEDTCSCTPQDQSEYWESLKNQFEDQSVMLKAKELELREKIAQVESLMADQSSNSCSGETNSDVPRVFPRRPESPERDANPSLEQASKCSTGFFQKVMENAKSILTMKCSAIHPSSTASEEPTRETDSSCHCCSETQQSSKSTSSKAVSFETVPQPRGSSSEFCLCDKDSATKNDTTADSYSQEVNNSFSCSVTCSSEATPNDSGREGYVCSSCCLASSTQPPSKQGSRGISSYDTSTYLSRKACSCNTSRTQAVDKHDKLSEALVDTANRDTRMITSPCQICCKRRVKSLSDQQTEARITFDTKPPGKTSACQVCLEIKKLAKLSDKQVEAQAVTASKATKVAGSACNICAERRSQSASKYFDKQIEAQAATSSKHIEAVSASVNRATRITNSSCRICLERRSQSAGKATGGQFLTPARQAEAASSSRSTRITGTACSGCFDRTTRDGAENKDKEKPSFVNLQSCWVNPLQNTAKKAVTREMLPSRDNASPNQQAGGVSCTPDSCPEFVSRKPNVGSDGGDKRGPCRVDTCPDFGGDSSGQLPCREDTCPDFSGDSSGQLPCREDTCPDFSGDSSGQLPCREDTCSYLSGESTGQLPCREQTCPDFGGSKRSPCRDDTCPVVTAITKSLTAPNVSFGKRTEKRKSTCNIGTCPSAKRVRSRSNIRDMDNQCAFIGSPVLNSSNFKGFGDTNVVKVDCCCCTEKEEPLPDTTSTEKCIKCHMQELLEREKNYDSVFQTFQNMANQPTYCCMAAAEKNHAQGDVRRITDELRLENQILKSELMELKYEMKQCLEKVEGPMKQKLQTEKCKCAKLQQELTKTSENMMASQDSYMREMNALKLQLCVACSNMTDLNAINKRLKEEMKSLDCMCSKLEDDLVKQKLNEADTIRMLTKRSTGLGEGATPAQPCTAQPTKKPQENQSETFKCDSNLHVIARKLSKTLKESAPCEECSKLPELTGAAKLIKDLTDLVESRKIDRSSLDSMESRRDCACQSLPRTEDQWCQCNNFRDVGAGEFPVRAEAEDAEDSKDGGVLPKPTETLFSASPAFADKNESSHFGMKPTTSPPGDAPAVGREPNVAESQFSSAHNAPCPMICDDKSPCAPIQIPCLVFKSETAPDLGEKIPSDRIPGKATIESGTEPCPEICGDSAPCALLGKPCALSKKDIDSDQPPERVFKDTETQPCPAICADPAPCARIGKPCAPSKEDSDQPPARVLKDTGTEPCPAICADLAPCALIDKPCTRPKEEKTEMADKTPGEVIEGVLSPPGVEPFAEPSGDTSSEPTPLKTPTVSPEAPTPCPQVCGDTAPCYSFGRPCQLPPSVEVKTLPEQLEELAKIASITSTEETVRYITSILLKNVLPADSKEKTLALVEPKDREVLSEARASIFSSREAARYVTDLLLKSLAGDSTKEIPVALVASEARDVPPEGVAEEVPLGGAAEPKKSSQVVVTDAVEVEKPEQVVEDLAKDEPIAEERVEEVLEQETDKKGVEAVPTERSEDEPEEPPQKETPAPDLEVAVEKSPADETAAGEKSEEVAEAVIHEIVPIGSNTNLIVPVEEKPTDLKKGEGSALVSNASSQAGPGEEILLEEIILDPELGDKPSAVSGEKPEVPVVSEEKPTSVEKMDKITQSAEKKLFEETITGDLPFTVETEAVILEEPPTGLHVTTTVTMSGNLEVITEGPAGLIETALTYKEDGTIEVVTQITELSQEALDVGDPSSAATEDVEEKKRSSKFRDGSTTSPESRAKFEEEKQKLVQEAKQKDSLLSGDSELTGLETVSDYTKDTTGMSSTGKSSATDQMPKDKGVDSVKTDAVAQQTSQVPTYTKSTGGEIPGEAATSTDEKLRRESEVVSPTTMGEVAVSSHVVSSEKATAEATEKAEITVRTSPISTKDTATESGMKETARQQTTTVETVGRSTESEPGVSEATTQDSSDARSGPGFDKGDVDTEESTDTSEKSARPILSPVREITEEGTTGGTQSDSLRSPVGQDAVVSSEQQSERGEPVSKQDTKQDERKTPSRSWQTEESDERTNVSDIAEDAPSKAVKQAAIRQKRDCACQSSTPAEQSCQCCDCKDVGVSTSKDNETNTETKMTIQKLPVKKCAADGKPKCASNDVYETAEGTPSSRGGDTAEAISLDTGKTQGTADEMSTLNEESQLDTKYSDAQDKSNARKELIASGEPRESPKPTTDLVPTVPSQRETSNEPSDSYKSAKEIKSSSTVDAAKGKQASGSESENERKKPRVTTSYSTPEKRRSPEPDSEKKLDKAEAKRKGSEVPDSVSKLSDKDNPPLTFSSEGKRQKKKRSSKLDRSSCDCPGVCQCVVCSPEIIAMRKAMTGTADPPDRQSEKLCCCTYPQPAQRTQAVYMQVPKTQDHQPGCSCCVPPPRTEAFLRSTNLNQGAVPKQRKRTSIDDVFQPAEDPIERRREAPSKKLPHARSCECIDCLCLPKIQKIAQMREFPVVKDEKQIYQVSTMKCECINAVNARKLVLERSRIPIATNSNASPPKVRAPTPTACTCDECRCSPCGDQAKGQPVVQVQSAARANQVASQMGSGGGVNPSQLANQCECEQCECSVCFNKPASVQDTKSAAQVPLDEPQKTKSATPAPSVRIKTKNCCCKGECTCEPCPVDNDDKAKVVPSMMSKTESEKLLKGSEKLLKASSLTRPEDCDCVKCVCPMAEAGAESAFQGTPSALQGTTSAIQGTPSAIQGTQSGIQGTPSALQGTPSTPGGPPHPEECDCIVCACPNVTALLPPAASNMSKIDSKFKPPAETQPGTAQKPADCDCDTCYCPGTGGTNAQGDQAEECTCAPCVCPGAASMKQPVVTLQPIPESAPIPVSASIPVGAPIPVSAPIAECDCTVCECSPCADPKRRKPDVRSGPAPCDCPKCECDPCADPAKTNEPLAQKESRVGDVPAIAGDDRGVAAVSRDKRDTEHPQGCTCDVCECPGKDKARGTGDEQQAEAVAVTEQLPTCESSFKAPEPHPDDCICAECLCSEGANVPVKVSHPDNCTCAECMCLEEVMVTASDFSQGVTTKPSVGFKTDTGTHPKDCTCAECKCPEDATQTEGRFPHGDGCKCPECLCVECYEKVDRFAHALECQCGDCLCTDCTKMRQGESAMKDSKSVQMKPSKLGGAVSFVEQSEKPQAKCTCAKDSLCEDCYFLKEIVEYKECKCGVCFCQDCAYMTAGAETVLSPAAAQNEPVAPVTSAVTPPWSCRCIECQCDICTKEKATEATKTAEVVGTQGHPETCTCLACMCIECFDKNKAGAGDKSIGPGIPAAASVYGPTSAEKRNPDCKCVDCTCLDCSKEGPTPITTIDTQMCKCGYCTCVNCAYKPSQQTQPCASPETVQLDQCLPESEKKTVDSKLGDPPPFETPLRNLCDCNTCPCVICADKRQAGASTVPAVSSTFPAVASTIPAVAGTFPAVASTIPAVASTIPAVASTIPAVANTFPAVASTIPAVTSTFPAVASTIPAVASTIPAVASTFPAVASTIPAVASTIPAVASTIPAVASTFPAVASTPAAMQANISYHAQGEAPPFEVPVRIPCNCPECSCSEGKQNKEPGVVFVTDQRTVSAPATAEAPPFTAPIRIPCTCVTCTCPNCNKEGGQYQIPQDGGPMLVQYETVPLQSAPSVAVSQRENMPDRPSSAPGGARPASRIHCECPTCVCPENVLDFQSGRLSDGRSTEIGKVSGQPSQMSGKQSNMSRNPQVSAQTSYLSAKQSQPGRPLSTVHCECPSCRCPNFLAGQIPSPQRSHISGDPSHVSGKQSTQISFAPSVSSQKQSTLLVAEPLNVSANQSAQMAGAQCSAQVSAQTSHISGPQSILVTVQPSTQVTAQPSHISGQQSTLVTGQPSHISGQSTQVSAQPSHISGQQSTLVTGQPSHISGQSTQVSAQPSHISGDPSHVSGKQSTQIAFAPSVSSQKQSTLLVAQPLNVSEPCAQVSAQTSHVSGQQSTPVAAQTSLISGKQSAQVKAQPSHISGQQFTQVTGQPSHISGQQSTQVPTQQSHISGQQYTQEPTQQSHISGQQYTQVTAQQSHISGQPFTQVASKVPDCDCPTCVCTPCPDGRISQPQQQQQTGNLPDNIETHPDNCVCPVCCACDARMAAIDLTRLNDEALERKIQKDKKENCECREQIKEIRKALTKIKCACTEAELKAMKSKPLVKQASTFGQTMSGLKLALTNLQEKCKAKDKMIDAMTGELKQRTSSKTFDKVLNKSVSDAPDYDKAGDVKSSDPSHEVISTNVLYTVEEERETAAKSTFDAKLSRAMETEKKKKKSTKSCKCGKSHRSKEPQNIDVSGFEIVDIRRITQDSIIIKWKPPRGSSITGYDIYINGVNKSKVMSGGRTSAMIHSLDLSATIQVTIYAVTKCGRCEPPAIAIYEVRP